MKKKKKKENLPKDTELEADRLDVNLLSDQGLTVLLTSALYCPVNAQAF